MRSVGTLTNDNTSKTVCLRGTPPWQQLRSRCAAFVQLSLRCTPFLAALALAAAGCDPHPGPPPVTPDGGTIVGGVRLFAAVRLAVEGEPWEPLEAPVLADELRLEQLSLAVAAVRSPGDRVNLPVPQSSAPALIELVRGPRDIELLGASPAIYGRAVLDIAAPPGGHALELRLVLAGVTYVVISDRSMTIDERCGGDAVELDPNMRGRLLLSLPAEELVGPIRDLEPTSGDTVRIDAASAPDELEQIEQVLAGAWRLDCSSSIEEPPTAAMLSEESADSP